MCTAFPFFLPLFSGRKKAFGLSPSWSLTPPPPSLLSLFCYRLLLKPCFFLIRLGKVPLLRLQRDLASCLRVSWKLGVLCPSRGPWWPAPGWGEEKRGSWPERAEGLVRPVLCMCHRTPKRSRFAFFPCPFSPGLLDRVMPFLCFKASPILISVNVLGFGYIGGENRTRIIFHVVSEPYLCWGFVVIVLFFSFETRFLCVVLAVLDYL